MFGILPNKEHFFAEKWQVIQKIQIINGLGAIVFAADKPNEEVNLSDLAAGMYYVKAWKDKNCFFIKKIIKK